MIEENIKCNDLFAKNLSDPQKYIFSNPQTVCNSED